jgi:arsenate reductase (thioredoxin)
MALAFFARAGGEARSAGTRPSAEPDENVVGAMRELGVDIAGHIPRSVERADVEWADLVIRMGCGDECAILPGKEYRDWPIEDPIGKSLDETRPIRDEVARRVAALAAELRESGFRGGN